MKILPSHKITGQLLDVILEAKQELVLVSPYVNFSYDKQVSAALIAARNRGVKIDFFIREEASNQLSKDQVASLHIVPRLVPNLHAKFYFNETTGVITSLNLLSSSIGNSIEIGCQLETAEDLAELRHFVAQFLLPQETSPPSKSVPPAPAQSPPASPNSTPRLSREERRLHVELFGAVLADYLNAHVDRRASIEQLPTGGLSIRAAGNTFTLEVTQPNQRLQLVAIVSGSEADRFPTKARVHLTAPTFDYQLKRGGKGYYDTIRAIGKHQATAAQVDKFSHAEKYHLLNEVSQLILAVDAYKADWK